MKSLRILFVLFLTGLASPLGWASVAQSDRPDALVSSWAQSWESKDFEAYAGFYSEAFSTDGFGDRDAWLRYRKPRLEKPRQIEVRLYDLRVLESRSDQLTVEFVQHYRSDKLRVYSLKKQVWVREGAGWRILDEKAVDLPKGHPVVKQAIESPVVAPPAAVAAPESAQPVEASSAVAPVAVGEAQPTTQPPSQQQPAGPASAESAAGAAAPPPQPPRVQFARVRFDGDLTLFTPEELQAVLQDSLNKPLTFEEIEALAAQITRHYRDRGFVAAAAILPQQDFASGELQLLVFEGLADPKEPVRVQAAEGLRLQPKLMTDTLIDALGTGPIEQTRLERGLLLLSDIPGVRAQVNLEPGDTPGTARAVIEASEGDAYDLVAGASNHGARTTGRNVLSVEGKLNNPLGHGEQLGLQYKPTDKQDQETFFLQGSVPVHPNGLRLGIAAGYFSYQVDSEDEPNFFRGKGDELTLSLRMPLVRSRSRNEQVSLEATAKNMKDNQGTEQIKKKLSSFTLSYNQDATDLASGFSHYWSLGLNRGDLDLTPTQANFETDADALRTHGGYTRYLGTAGLVARLPEEFSVSLSTQLQGATKNLSSSEKMSLGGPFGVRAYPVGEASGDEGLRVSAELRRFVGSDDLFGDFSGVLFYDWGRTKRQKEPLDGSEAVNQYNLQGWGLGLQVSKSGEHDFRLVWAKKIGNNQGRVTAADGVSLVDNDGTNDDSRIWANFSVIF